MKELFVNYPAVILFLHIVSAVVWIGGMIAVRAAVHPSLQSLQDENLKLEKTLQITGRLFNLVMPFIILLIITGVIFEMSGFKDMKVHIKEALWSIMVLNYIFMYIKRLKAQKMFKDGNLKEAKAALKPVPAVLLPINIVLGMASIFLGILLNLG